MELQSALENRKSIRSYLSKDVEPEKLTALIEAASLAPSWKNSQTARYYVIHTPEKLEQIRATLPEFNRKNCEQAPALIITTVVLNRSGYERNGEPTNELGNGWGFYDCGLVFLPLLFLLCFFFDTTCSIYFLHLLFFCIYHFFSHFAHAEFVSSARRHKSRD